MNNKVVVLHNKISNNPTIDELDVLDQVKVVNEALIKLGYQTAIIPFSFDLNQAITDIKAENPKFVFNLVEGIDNDGQLITIAPAILDYLKIPYTGCTKEATFLTCNKVLTKKMMAAAGIPTAEWVTVNNEKDNVFIKGEKYIIKAIWEDASIGLEEDSVVLVDTQEELVELIKKQNDKLKIEFFAEKYLHGRDFSVPVLAGKLLPTREMQFLDYDEDRVKVLGYKSKWEKDTDEYDKTEITFEFSEKDAELLEKIAELSKKCWNEFSLNGYARIDFRTDIDENIYVLEINPNPCIAEDTAFYLALEEVGIDYADAIKTIIEDMKVIY